MEAFGGWESEQCLTDFERQVLERPLSAVVYAGKHFIDIQPK
jgi:hypothetical protein